VKKTAFLIAALALIALPVVAHADGFFALTANVVKVGCSPVPGFDAPPALQCQMDLAPNPGLSREVIVYCLDPDVAQACNSYQPGDPVIVIGEETKGGKVVTKIGYWTKGSF
jgi:hypothetical protein